MRIDTCATRVVRNVPCVHRVARNVHASVSGVCAQGEGREGLVVDERGELDASADEVCSPACTWREACPLHRFAELMTVQQLDTRLSDTDGVSCCVGSCKGR